MSIVVPWGSTRVCLRIPIDCTLSFENTETHLRGSPMSWLTHASTMLTISTIADNEASPTVYQNLLSPATIQPIATVGSYVAPASGCCRFAQVHRGYHPGLYEIQLPDARFAVPEAQRLFLSVTGPIGMFPAREEVLLIEGTAAAVWDAFLSEHTTSGTFGARFATLARTGEVTATSPVSSDGTTLAVVIGYDYSEANGKACLWTDKSGIWPDLTDATLTLRIYNTATSGDLFTVTGTVVDAGSTSQSAKYSLTAAQTALFAASKNVYVFFVEASFSGADKTCLVRGWVYPTIAPTKNPNCGT